MEQSPTLKPAGSLRIAGASPFFPVAASHAAFWKQLLTFKGLLPGLLAGEWPFGEFFQPEDIQALKGLITQSGAVSSGKMDPSAFEMLSAVLKLSDIVQLLSLVLGKLAIESALEQTPEKSLGKNVAVVVAPMCVHAVLAIEDLAHQEINLKDLAPQITRKLCEKFEFKPLTIDSPVGIPWGFSLSLHAISQQIARGEVDAVVMLGRDPLLATIAAKLAHMQDDQALSPTTVTEAGLEEVPWRHGCMAMVLQKNQAGAAGSMGPGLVLATPHEQELVLGFPGRQAAFPLPGAGVAEVKPLPAPPALQLMALTPGGETREKPWEFALSEIPWVQDHRPNFVIPTLPLMFTLDWLCRSIPEIQGKTVVAVPRLEALHWISFEHTHLAGRLLYRSVSPHLWAVEAAISREQKHLPAVRAEIEISEAYSAPDLEFLSPLKKPVPQALPYYTHEVPHGESFQLMERWTLGENGASARIRNVSPLVPTGMFNPALLDASLHAIPWTNLPHWFPRLPLGCVGVPLIIEAFRVYRPVPVQGLTDVEIRTEDHDYSARIHVWLRQNNVPYLSFTVLPHLLSLGAFAALTPDKRMAFFRDFRAVTGAGISTMTPDRSTIAAEALAAIDWLPQTVSRLYRLPVDSNQHLRLVLQKDHAAQATRLHPAEVQIDPATGACLNLPYNDVTVSCEAQADPLVVTGNTAAAFSWKKLRQSWVDKTGKRRFFHDLLAMLCGTFIRRVVVQSPAEFEIVRQRPVMYVANHQIGIESPLFMTLSYALSGRAIQAIAKPDHVDAWLNFLFSFATESLGEDHPFKLVYFDKARPQGLLEFLQQGNQQASLLVHVEGTRATGGGQPVVRLSSIFLDMAIQQNIPLVPTRFVGGLPLEVGEKRLDFPFKGGKQDYFLGTPIMPETLRAMPYGQRPKYVMERINGLGPLNDEDTPIPPDRAFVEKTKFFIDSFGFPKMQAMLFAILGQIDDPSEETAMLIQAVKSGKAGSAGSEIPPVLRNFLGHVKAKFAQEKKG
jgi:1-acyl-sn-glycerol-3-phosphate acyltransferase